MVDGGAGWGKGFWARGAGVRVGYGVNGGKPELQGNGTGQHPQHCQHHPHDADDAGEGGGITLGGGTYTMHIYTYVCVIYRIHSLNIYMARNKPNQKCVTCDCSQTLTVRPISKQIIMSQCKELFVLKVVRQRADGVVLQACKSHHAVWLSMRIKTKASCRINANIPQRTPTSSRRDPCCNVPQLPQCNKPEIQQHTTNVHQDG